MADVATMLCAVKGQLRVKRAHCRRIGLDIQSRQMTADALREAIRNGRPFKVTMADGRTLEVPHGEFAMLSGTGQLFYVAKPNSNLCEVIDVALITGVEQEGKLPTR